MADMAAIPKQEYLKRYLSNSDSGKKKKKKKVPKTASKRPTSIIVDDDITVQDVAVANAQHETNEFEEDADEAPAVYEDDGVTKISLETFKKREEDKKTKWAPISGNLQTSPETREDSKASYDSDNSPPRIRPRQDTPDLSPRRGRSRDSPDQSPPRKKPGQSPLSRQGKLRNSPDQSPLRKRQDRCPPHRTVKDLSSTHSERREPSIKADDSPPRSRRRRHDSVDSLPDQVHNRRTDLSPNRQRHSHSSSDRPVMQRARNDSPYLSPPCPGINRDSKLSPPRKRSDSGSDQSPPRKRTNSDSDQSPPRNRTNSDSDQSPPRKQKRSERGAAKKPASEDRMSSGRKAGLLSASDLKKENERKRQQEAEMYSGMDPSVSGKGSETVYRDKMGRKKDIKLDRIKRREEERKEMEDNEKFMEWGRGVVQTKQNQEKVEDYLHEVDKPLARYRDDKDLEKMLKDQEREDDPMLAYMKQKKKKQDITQGKKEKPVYKGPDPPPNRFNIRPGYRWDGVDRSNGFERKRFAMLANKMATQSQAYKWSTEDM